MNEPAAQGDISAVELLGVGFVIMKILHVIHWSWWWVTAPFWAPVALAGLIVSIAALVMFVRDR